MSIKKMLSWLEKEKQKDNQEINNYKSIQIQEIKNIKKEDLFNYKSKKMSIWQRLRKTLMGY
jgi:ribosomal protein L11